MPKFRFAVKDEWGMRKTGVMEASTLEAARKRLLQGGFEVESVVDEGKSLDPDIPDKLPTPSGKRLLYVSAVFFGFAVLAFLGPWLLRPQPPQPPREIRFQLVGQLDPKAPDPGQARLLVDFPEIPLRLEYPWKEIATAERAFAIEISFSAPQAPGYAWVRLSGTRVPKAVRMDSDASERPDLRKIEVSGDKAEIKDLQWKP